MTELHWQTVFLLVAAFFFGAVIACSLKRKFYDRKSARADATPAAVTPAATEPKIEGAPGGQTDSGSERFGNALAGGTSVAASTPAPASASEPMPAKPAVPEAAKEEPKLVVPPTVLKVEPSKPVASLTIALIIAAIGLLGLGYGISEMMTHAGPDAALKTAGGLAVYVIVCLSLLRMTR